MRGFMVVVDCGGSLEFKGRDYRLSVKGGPCVEPRGRKEVD